MQATQTHEIFRTGKAGNFVSAFQKSCRTAREVNHSKPMAGASDFSEETLLELSVH